MSDLYSSVRPGLLLSDFWLDIRLILKGVEFFESSFSASLSLVGFLTSSLVGFLVMPSVFEFN